MTQLESLRIGFAFAAGVATFFAPCAFPMLPGYVAYFVGSAEDVPETGKRRALRALAVGVVTSAGFFVVYAILAGIVVGVGAQALANISVLEAVVGVGLIVLGAGMAAGRIGAAPIHMQLPERTRSLGGFFGFGVVYAAAAAGCTAPVFVGIATLGLSTGPLAAVVLLATYAAGMSTVMILLTGLSALGRDATFRVVSRQRGLITRIAGVLLVVAGIAQLYFFFFEFGGLRLLGLA